VPYTFCSKNVPKIEVQLLNPSDSKLSDGPQNEL